MNPLKLVCALRFLTAASITTTLLVDAFSVIDDSRIQRRTSTTPSRLVPSCIPPSSRLYQQSSSSDSNPQKTNEPAPSVQDLMEMDVVIYTSNLQQTEETNSEDDKNVVYYQLAVMEEQGCLQPLSAWSNDPVFGTSLEFLVDEEDRTATGLQDVTLIAAVPAHHVSYGSRQVGGGKGPGNPHGEESELLYYITQEYLEEQPPQPREEKDVMVPQLQITLKPHLEILW